MAITYVGGQTSGRAGATSTTTVTYALTGAVSYTHLDVYKRQMYYIPSTDTNAYFVGDTVASLAGYRNLERIS